MMVSIYKKKFVSKNVDTKRGNSEIKETNFYNKRVRFGTHLYGLFLQEQRMSGYNKFASSQLKLLFSSHSFNNGLTLG